MEASQTLLKTHPKQVKTQLVIVICTTTELNTVVSCHITIYGGSIWLGDSHEDLMVFIVLWFMIAKLESLKGISYGWLYHPRCANTTATVTVN